MSETVYKRILKQLNSDSEDDNFLEENRSDIHGKPIAFMDGMIDRMSFLYKDVSDDDIKGLKNSIYNAAFGNVDGAMEQLKYTPIHNGARMMQVAKNLENWIIENKEEIATDDLLEMIKRLLLKSEILEEVKLGLFLYEKVFDNHPEFDEIIINYAKSGEFAKYAMNLVKRMDDGNQKLFELVKNSTGGTLVSAVNILDPESQEIEDWIFREGTDPFLSYYYSSVPITKKCNLIKRMKDPNLSDDDYYILCRVIFGYFEEGLADGYETLTNVMEIEQAFFDICKNRITDFMLSILGRMKWTIEQDIKYGILKNPEIAYCLDQCNLILNSESVRETIISHVNQGEWIDLGDDIGILNDAIVIKAIKKDPIRNVYCFRYLDSQDYKKEVLELYRSPETKNIILSKKDNAASHALFEILTLCNELNVPDKDYFKAALDSNDFMFPIKAANSLVEMDEKGILIDEDLLFQAQNYLYKVNKDKEKKKIRRLNKRKN